jgi:hypothetical protein
MVFDKMTKVDHIGAIDGWIDIDWILGAISIAMISIRGDIMAK